ncbi:MAG: twin-arginine translocase TatA/TatE family subunit [Alphaproteobacteria bacterium]|nr:twin-arginine translocase TatA/TatE family subunit [Alphaproteobacteria bacterium]
MDLVWERSRGMGLGIVELALVIGVVVRLVGTGKLTRAMGDLARGVRVFRDEMKDVAPAGAAGAAPAPAALPSPAHRDRPARP